MTGAPVAPASALPLVLVEWVDSAQPIPGWRFITEAPALEVIQCRSVGWVVGESEGVLMLAPNVGEEGSDAHQACGFIRIPRQSITRRAVLVEAP